MFRPVLAPNGGLFSATCWLSLVVIDFRKSRFRLGFRLGSTRYLILRRFTCCKRYHLPSKQPVGFR
uniref:Uncharacterized protein n=1 Tax=Arundo donax TaxID=35708 RepID=A0A0A9BXV9_ARUDO